MRNDVVLFLPERIQEIPYGTKSAARKAGGWGTSASYKINVSFMEMMTLLLSRETWRCRAYDSVHGWGLDFSLRRSIELIVHQEIPSVGSQNDLVHEWGLDFALR
ncbi:unnamed protein product [Prunus armeniaca]|uniref:Uncharacterized protein n=1 Tax=Prunus armeniaca TaxID=36596 RepID=A0A6J5XKU5_PRUAR|nr:unnamed protein product [Prunus armeniaca]